MPTAQLPSTSAPVDVTVLAKDPSPSDVHETLVSTTAVIEPTRCDTGSADGDVLLWHSLDSAAATAALTTVIDEFNAIYAGDVVATKVGSYQDLLAALVSTSPSEWPDVVIAAQGATRSFVDSGRFLRPGECADVDELVAGLLPVVRETYLVSGDLVAVPYGVSAPVLFVDTAEYTRAGLDPADLPTDIPSLLSASRALRDSGVSPHGLVLDDGVCGLVVAQHSAQRGELTTTPGNGHDLASVRVSYATAATVETLATLRDAVDGGHAVYIGPNNSGFDDLVKIVAERDGGVMSLHTSASLGDVLDLVDSGSFPGVTVGVGTLPGPGVGALVGGNAIWVTDSGDAESAGAAWQLVEWLSSGPNIARLAAATGYVPPFEAAATDEALIATWDARPQMRVAYDLLAATPASDATAGSLIGPSIERDHVLYGVCSDIFVEGADIEDALRSASDLVNAAIEQYEIGVDQAAGFGPR